MTFHDIVQGAIDIFWNIPFIIIYHLYLSFKSHEYRRIRQCTNESPERWTIFKSLQLYELVREVDADEIKCGNTNGIHGYMVALFKDNTLIGTVTVCRCCGSIGNLNPKSE